MKNNKTKKGIIAAVAALLLVLGLWAGFSSPVSLSADAYATNPYDAEYGYTIEQYRAEMTVERNRKISVKETITVSFEGYNSHGIIRDLPLSGGVRYQNISADCDSADFAPYFKTDDFSFISYYLRGKGVVKGQQRTYTVTYDMIVPALSEEGYLPLDVIGYGWQTKINDVTVSVTVPDGLVGYQVYSGESGTTGNDCEVETVRNGNTLTLTSLGLPQNVPHYSEDGYYYTSAGITLDLCFESGVLTASFDRSVIYVLLIGVALLIAAVLVKLFVCRQPDMIKTINLTAPDEMDPLLMGLLIDNKIDSEDLGSLVFWLASEGYLHIDLSESQKDPTLYRTSKPLAANVPADRKSVV